MLPPVTLAKAIAGGCLLLLVGALVMSWRGRSPLAPEPARTGARIGPTLSAALAPIGPLAEFSPNEDNPFVPLGSGRTPSAPRGCGAGTRGTAWGSPAARSTRG